MKTPLAPGEHPFDRTMCVLQWVLIVVVFSLTLAGYKDAVGLIAAILLTFVTGWIYGRGFQPTREG